MPITPIEQRLRGVGLAAPHVPVGHWWWRFEPRLVGAGGRSPPLPWLPHVLLLRLHDDPTDSGAVPDDTRFHIDVAAPDAMGLEWRAVLVHWTAAPEELAGTSAAVLAPLLTSEIDAVRHTALAALGSARL